MASRIAWFTAWIQYCSMPPEQSTRKMGWSGRRAMAKRPSSVDIVGPPSAGAGDRTPGRARRRRLTLQRRESVEPAEQSERDVVAAAFGGQIGQPAFDVGADS